MENRKNDPLLVDKKAVEIANKINYNFKSLKIPEKTNIMMCLRAKLIDNFVSDFLSNSNEVVALHLRAPMEIRLAPSIVTPEIFIIRYSQAHN